jgi:hypothetical protein
MDLSLLLSSSQSILPFFSKDWALQDEDFGRAAMRGGGRKKGT